MVSRQNRWSSYSVTVLPGQCLYVAPTSNSSKYRPNPIRPSVSLRLPDSVADRRVPRAVGPAIRVAGHIRPEPTLGGDEAWTLAHRAVPAASRIRGSPTGRRTADQLLATSIRGRVLHPTAALEELSPMSTLPHLAAAPCRPGRRPGSCAPFAAIARVRRDEGGFVWIGLH